MTAVPQSAGQPDPLRRRRRLFVSAALLLGATALVAFVAFIPSAVNQAPPREVIPVNIEVERLVALPELADTFDVTAVIEPNRIVKVAAEVPGRIERYGARSRDVAWRGRIIAGESVLTEGEPVAAGDPLVYLNRELLEARHARAKAQYEYDEREYRRILDLYERGSTSRTELDDARTNRKLSQATLDEAVRQLDRATITAPIRGVLNRLPLELGEYAGVGNVVAEIVDLDPVKVVADVSERDVPFLNVGDQATVSLPSGAGGSVSGDITYINAVADAGTRTTRVEVTVANPDHSLRSGQIVNACFTRRVLRDVLMIPLESVLPLEDGMAVYVERGGVAERRDVTLGVIKGHRVRAVTGLAAGENLIVVGQRYVGQGQAVKVIASRSGAPDGPTARPVSGAPATHPASGEDQP